MATAYHPAEGTVTHPKRGSLQVIFGPMFSGKSTELARRIRRHKIANARVLVVKYAGDTRYENECVGEESQDGTPRMSSLKSRVITHDRVSLPAVPLRTLAQMDNVVGNFDVVGIDEGQFFPDLHEACDRWARLGKTVIVAALDATFQRKPFNDVLALVPIAEEITKLSAVCSNCGEDAAFTKRVNSTSTDVELIGGSETYVASCRDCFELEFENLTTEMCARKGASSQAAGKSSAQKHRFDDAASTRKRRSSAFGATPNALRGSVGASDKKPTHGDDTEKTSEATPSLAATPPMSLSRVGEKMRSLNLESPSTPAVFGGFGSPMTVAKKSATETNAEKGAHGEKTNSAGAGSARKKKALGLGAAAAAREVNGGPVRVVRGAGGPGRSPIMDLASRGMGAVARSPLASVR